MFEVIPENSFLSENAITKPIEQPDISSLLKSFPLKVDIQPILIELSLNNSSLSSFLFPGEIVMGEMVYSLVTEEDEDLLVLWEREIRRFVMEAGRLSRLEN